jgi:hypothetical protein
MKSALAVGLLVSTVLAAGCGKEREPYKAELVAVTGVVKLGDKPLDNATVTFTPTGKTKGFGASGKTDANGSYSLTTPMGNAGVLPGEYKVSISKVVDSKTGAAIDLGSLGKGGGSPKQAVPTKYSDPATTELKKTVPAGGGKIDFALK